MSPAFRNSSQSPSFPKPARRGKRAAPRRPETRRLLLESLEDRCLLTFAPAATYPVGMYPQAIVSADFNNDMIQDLAVANYSDSSVGVLLGNGTAGVGDGTFQSAVNSPTGSNPLSLAVGDFNGDGTLDLATANGGGDVSVLLGIEDDLGNGTGTFKAPTSIDSVSGPQSVAVGDFNGDGKMDLGVTSNVSVYDGQYCYSGSYGTYCYPHYHTESQANVLLGNGDVTGSFSAPKITSLGYGYHTLAVAANLNGDTYDDFVTFNSDYGSVNVLLGDSGGYLQYYSDNYTGDYSYSVAAGDVNGDTFTDLVTANFYGNTVGVLLGDGGGSFSAAGNYSTGGYPTSVVLGDFTHDMDGNLDVAAVNYYTNQVGVLYGGGDGSFSTPALSAVGTNPFRIAAGDFNGDGWLDAATANSGLGNVSVLINDHDWPNPPPPPPPYVYID